MSSDSPDRQLLAIVFTDVVGYTALTERDEASAVRVRDAHRNLVQTLVAQFGGEVVDATGDESLSIFPSALRAVDCAVAIQGALRSDPDLRLRIGIHLGDVLRRDGEVIGEGVNVAARIRPLAEPGGICVSEPVYQMIRSRARVSAKPMGSKSLKNVGEPVGVYALSAQEAAAPAAPRRSRRGWVGGAAALVALLGLAFLLRAPLTAWAVVNLPRLAGASVEQEIGFATTPDGVKVAYATAGEGPPLVLVLGWGTHLTEGLGSPLYDAGGALAWWARRRTVVRYDGRGFGLSDRDVTDFSLERRVSDLETVVDALGLERFALYGYSAGGPAAVAYAARHPERLTHLVLAATFVDRSTDDPEREAALRGLMSFVETGWSSTPARAALVEFLAPEANEVERRVLMHFMSVAADGEQIVRFLRASGASVKDSARQIRVPTLVVASDADTTVPLARSRVVASAIPGARLEIVEGASHIGASLVDPRVLELVSDFLAEGD